MRLLVLDENTQSLLCVLVCLKDDRVGHVFAVLGGRLPSVLCVSVLAERLQSLKYFLFTC